MPRLICDGRPIADVAVASTFLQRLQGLLGKRGVDGALAITRTNSVHTLGMRFSIDVAFCDKKGRVLDIITMQPNRLGKIRPGGNMVVESEAGRMKQWGIGLGSILEIVP